MQIITRIFAIIVIFMLLTISAVRLQNNGNTKQQFGTAGDTDKEKQLNKAENAYNTGQYNDALKIYQSLADKGNMIAQNNVGLIYSEGKGVKQDDKEAFKWFTLSADQHYSVAQYNLGLFYENGQGG